MVIQNVQPGCHSHALNPSLSDNHNKNHCDVFECYYGPNCPYSPSKISPAVNTMYTNSNKNTITSFFGFFHSSELLAFHNDIITSNGFSRLNIHTGYTLVSMTAGYFDGRSGERYFQLRPTMAALATLLSTPMIIALWWLNTSLLEHACIHNHLLGAPKMKLQGN